MYVLEDCTYTLTLGEIIYPVYHLLMEKTLLTLPHTWNCSSECAIEVSLPSSSLDSKRWNRFNLQHLIWGYTTVDLNPSIINIISSHII